jgi:hypothetical protein
MTNVRLKAVLVLAVAIFGYAGFVYTDREPALPFLPFSCRNAVLAALERSGNNRKELAKALAGIGADRLPAMCDVISRMPNYDLANATASMLIDHVNYTFEVNKRVPWKLDENSRVFLDYVLPYRVACESLEGSRPFFARMLLPLVKKCPNTRDAALVVMQRSHDPSIERIEVGSAQPYDYAPLAAWPFARPRSGHYGCRYSAVLEVAMMRSAGIPAFIVESPADCVFSHCHICYYDTFSRQWRRVNPSAGVKGNEYEMTYSAEITGILRATATVVNYGYPPYMSGDYYGQQRLDKLACLGGWSCGSDAVLHHEVFQALCPLGHINFDGSNVCA